MKKDICKKVISMLSLYIENKLDAKDKLFIEDHFAICADCYQKYIEMQKIMYNLRFEYEKLLKEFECIEANNMFNIHEYENFYKNISPYIDDELAYDESINFRKYLVKSKTARSELASAYDLKNHIKKSFIDYKDNLKINLSKKVINQLKSADKTPFEQLYNKAAFVISVLVISLLLISTYMSFSYISSSFARACDIESIETLNIPNEEDMVEFFFSDNKEALLIDK